MQSQQDSATRSYSFGTVLPGVHMFSVRQGVPVVDSLEYAQCLLSAACAQVKSVADWSRDGDEEDISWAIYYLLEQVQALLGASVIGLRGIDQ